MNRQREIHALRERLSALEPVGLLGQESRFTLGSQRVDDALGGGLSRAALHEVVTFGSADAAAAIGFVTGLSRRAGGPSRAMLWVRQTTGEAEAGKLYPHGLFEMGLDPRSIIQVRLRDATGVLRAGIEGARCEALGCVVIEIWGDPKILDLTATRRLALGAEESGVPVFLLRFSRKVESSAAATRWQVRSLASRPLEADAPGHPAFDVTLVRQRAGIGGLDWKMEWNIDRHEFEEQALSRTVASLPFDREDQAAGAARWRQAG
ncbi:hypothetical protein GTW25_14995 [Aliihoeflea aestuarii]|jgi:protein ImuA|uniref:ImuA family protein n=1 Tax=Aliihoeflea aestuarii TaxID=453840 RepID=UPI0020957AF5|nr:hypothetical protein [Aliihoeflea aestuarii]MCO6392336.1 hypothetical protein [Aliihoeflea aestuarii]